MVTGLGKIREWLKTGPLHATDSQIDAVITQAQDLIRTNSKNTISQVTEVGTTVTHVVAGIFIVLFGTYFFLADGHLIWACWCASSRGPVAPARTPRVASPGGP